MKCGCVAIRHGIFPPIERSHGSFFEVGSNPLRKLLDIYLTYERFSESNFASLPHASTSFLHSTFSNGVNLFCFGNHQVSTCCVTVVNQDYNEGK